MPLLNRTEVLQATAPLGFPGRKIFVDGTNGSDVTGDGSEAAPLATIGAGAALLRSGRGDILTILGLTGGADYNETVLISAIDNFKIQGRGNPSIGEAPTTAGQTPTAVATFSGGTQASITITGHGFTAGQAVLLEGFDQSSSNYFNGIHEIKSATANEIRIDAVGQDTGATPFVGGPGADAIATQIPLTISGCKGVVVQDITFSGNLFADTWSGLAFVGANAGAGDVGSQHFVTQCAFGQASIGYDYINIPGLTGAGVGFVVEGCLFNPNLFSIISPNHINAGVGSVYVNGGVDPVIINNAWAYASTLGPFTWAPTGVIVDVGFNGSPSQGALLTLNRFPDGTTSGSSIQRDRLFHSYPVAQESTTPRYAASRNFFAEITTIGDIAMDDEDLLVDTAPLITINGQALETQQDLVWLNPVSQAAVQAGTMGQAIALAGYGGSVHVDTTGGGTAGTVLGVNGTPANPVDTLASAITLAAAGGFSAFTIRGTVALSQTFNNYTFIGVSPEDTEIQLNSQDVSGSRFLLATLSGTAVASQVSCNECVLDGITGLRGDFRNTALTGTITLAAGGNFNLFEGASAVPGTSAPILDLVNFTTEGFGMRAYSGGIEIQNMASASINGSIDYVAGQLILDSSSTAGTLSYRGPVQVTDNGHALTLQEDAALNKTEIAEAVWDTDPSNHITDPSTGRNNALLAYKGRVWYDSLAGNTSTVLGVDGTESNPVSSAAAVQTLLSSTGLRTINVRGLLTLTGVDWTDRVFIGNSPADSLVNVNGVISVQGSRFEKLVVFGDCNNSTIEAIDCTLASLVDVTPVAIRCGLSTTITLNNDASFVDCYSFVAGTGTPVLDLNSVTPIGVNIRRYSGGLEFQNMVAGANVSYDCIVGQYVLNANCLGGDLAVRGMAEKTDNSGLVTVTEDARLTRSEIVDDAWDEAIAGHLTAGSTGEALNDTAVTTDIELLDDHQRGTIRINTATDPWREEHLDVEDGTTVRDSFELYDGDGNAINSGNPLTNFVGERRRV